MSTSIKFTLGFDGGNAGGNTGQTGKNRTSSLLFHHLTVVTQTYIVAPHPTRNHEPHSGTKAKRPRTSRPKVRRRTAHRKLLEANSIKYQYEPALLINSDQKTRIWYPDFYLPEVTAYVEYFGLVGKQNYDDGIKRKETLYFEAGLAVIPVYPWTFSEDWEGYIMSELERITIHRYRSLMTKPYWTTHQKNNPNHARYRQGSSSHY